ncbi:tRNA-dihydrouridine synthase 2 [Cryptococcus neoformans]|nr:tRNA-dihydrouridine synthase 2 [Cryptococcus neoformans var. grubii Bt1]OWZ77988.1 tRNA-dihydrouridine synthase 2 [Cryptococcus neoformans var. grubii Bt85]OXG24927.1 tRNA-dihydrouridine synthase 2 [Cryptococcus neoformans var. grubii Ze90-1]OXH31888.1 tRNA-dihydrouridine synthase 2 [Cryptococcus neoformans var. grubii]
MSKLFRSIRLFFRPYLQPSGSVFPVSSTKMTSGTIRGASPATEIEHQSKRPRLEAEDTQISNPSGIDVQGSSSIVTDCSHSIISENDLIEEQMRLPIEYVRSYDNEINYKNKLVLAPMVRTGSLPMRLLSLYYGAGLVWSPEVVDKAIIGAERSVDPVTGVITYHKGQGPIFSTHPAEKPFLIFQIGSSNPELAVKAAQTVQQDVAGIDLNCGCPKPFSTHAGMGAALLSTPEILLDILRALLDSIPLPISCKIRLLPTQPSTLYLASRILRTGVRNLTVHCRTRQMRPGERALWERLGSIVDLGKRRGISVICNGDGEGWSNWERIKNETGADSLMLARSAERNPSVFLPSGPLNTVTDIVPKLLALSDYLKNPWGNTKFLLMQFKPSPPPLSNMSKAERKRIADILSQSKSTQDAAVGLGISLVSGDQLFREIQSKIDVETNRNIWQARREVKPNNAGDVEGKEAIEEEAIVDGFEVGVGPAQEQKMTACCS